MPDAPKVLFAGESWVTHSIHVKGADSFETSSYHEGGSAVIEALRTVGIEVTYQPCHVAADAFPFDMDALSNFDVIVLSDIGANTLLLPQRTFARSERAANRLELIRDFVHAGGGLLMVGGYMSFQGIGAKANYRGSPVEEVLPVRLLAGDDRRETPQGVTPDMADRNHPILSGLSDWPHFLGYNRVQLAENAHLVASVGTDPFIAVAEARKGRSAVFASDCGPHWGPPEFLAWSGYPGLWRNLVRWLARHS